MFKFKILDIQYLNKRINFVILIVGKLYNSIPLYRSSSQSQDQLPAFSDNLEFNIDSTGAKNSFLLVIIGDFNTKYQNC